MVNSLVVVSTSGSVTTPVNVGLSVAAINFGNCAQEFLSSSIAVVSMMFCTNVYLVVVLIFGSYISNDVMTLYV